VCVCVGGGALGPYNFWSSHDTLKSFKGKHNEHTEAFLMPQSGMLSVYIPA
jgi:hypothetical protein